MINNAVARRYAHALFALAQEKNVIENTEKDLQLVNQAVANNDQLAEVLNHKLIPAENKKELCQQIFAAQISQITMNFLMLTIDKKRENLWPEMVVEYSKMADEAKNLHTAQVTSAVAMSQEDIQALEKRLSKVTGKNIKVNVEVDPSIMAGLIVKIGDEVMDGSVKKRLTMLQSNLKQINFTVSGVN